MVRNRAARPRDEKRNEILEAAGRLFLQQGVEATSMAAVASEAGVAKNTVYWYFDDKDALLVAALSEQLRAARATWETDPADALAEQLVDIVGLFARIDALSSAVHARARTSPAVRDWHERFHAGSDRWLEARIAAHREAVGSEPASAEALATQVRIVTYAIEGLVAHDATPQETRRVCETLVTQLCA